MKRVAIMQPTYLPWSGYFGLMYSVDLFIFLDTVQFEHRSWQQRNRIKTPRGPQWLTVPVISKGKRDQWIQDVEIGNGIEFSKKHLKAIDLNYRKATHFNEVFSEVRRELNDPGEKLANLAISLILRLKRLLGINTTVMRSSELMGEGPKAELLASLCVQVGATEYVSPPGSKEYLRASSAFHEVGIPIRYFEFTHPEYIQLHGEFIPYMSCIDMMMNCGDRAFSLIKDGSSISE